MIESLSGFTKLTLRLHDCLCKLNPSAIINADSTDACISVLQDVHTIVRTKMRLHYGESDTDILCDPARF
jgi:acid phosphatase class B